MTRPQRESLPISTVSRQILTPCWASCQLLTTPSPSRFLSCRDPALPPRPVPPPRLALPIRLPLPLRLAPLPPLVLPLQPALQPALHPQLVLHPRPLPPQRPAARHHLGSSAPREWDTEA